MSLCALSTRAVLKRKKKCSESAVLQKDRVQLICSTMVDGDWRLAVGGWQLAVGGPWGRSLRVVPGKKKNWVP